MTKTPESIDDETLETCATGGMGMQDIKEVVITTKDAGGAFNVFKSDVDLDAQGGLDGKIGQVSTVAPAGTPWAKLPMKFKF